MTILSVDVENPEAASFLLKGACVCCGPAHITNTTIPTLRALLYLYRDLPPLFMHFILSSLSFDSLSIF